MAVADAQRRDSVQAIFSRIAGNYDLFNAVSSLGVYRHWLNVLVQDVARAAPQDILDVAGGTGTVSMAVARVLPWADITLSDVCPEMLEVAKSRLAQPAYANIGLKLADAQSLPFADNSYDAICCAYGVRNLQDSRAALAEFYRVIRPGGKVHIMEFATPPAQSWRRLYHLYLKHVVPTVGGLLTGGKDEFKYLRASILDFPAQRDFCALLHAAGFSDIRYRNLTGGITAVFNAVKPRQ
jgi:demethylmenaquinone methyltransferase/2-methoxy-6-polyprenyl-1,4-benzoquinol methylase